jgi:hypothetical protein
MSERRDALGGARLIGSVMLLLLAMTALIFAWAGTGESGLRMLVRATARSSLVLFGAAFTASSLRRLWPTPATGWLLRSALPRPLLRDSTPCTCSRSRASRAGDAFEIDLVTVIFGGGAYVMIALMAATSSDRAYAWLGRRRWHLLHRVGVYWIWIIFANSYTARAVMAVAGGTENRSPTSGRRLHLALLGLRIAAWVRARRRSRPAVASAQLLTASVRPRSWIPAARSVRRLSRRLRSDGPSVSGAEPGWTAQGFRQRAPAIPRSAGRGVRRGRVLGSSSRIRWSAGRGASTSVSTRRAAAPEARLPRAGADREQPRLFALELALDQGDDHRVLVGEVFVERADRDPRALGDVIRGAGVEATLLENPSCRVEDGRDGGLRTPLRRLPARAGARILFIDPPIRIRVVIGVHPIYSGARTTSQVPGMEQLSLALGLRADDRVRQRAAGLAGRAPAHGQASGR